MGAAASLAHTDPEKALKELRGILSVDPENYGALFHVAVVYHRLGKLDDAQRSYNSIRQLAKDAAKDTSGKTSKVEDLVVASALVNLGLLLEVRRLCTASASVFALPSSHALCACGSLGVVLPLSASGAGNVRCGSCPLQVR